MPNYEEWIAYKRYKSIGNHVREGKPAITMHTKRPFESHNYSNVDEMFVSTFENSPNEEDANWLILIWPNRERPHFTLHILFLFSCSAREFHAAYLHRNRCWTIDFLGNAILCDTWNELEQAREIIWETVFLGKKHFGKESLSKDIEYSSNICIHNSNRLP